MAHDRTIKIAASKRVAKVKAANTLRRRLDQKFKELKSLEAVEIRALNKKPIVLYLDELHVTRQE